MKTIHHPLNNDNVKFSLCSVRFIILGFCTLLSPCAHEVYAQTKTYGNVEHAVNRYRELRKKTEENADKIRQLYDEKRSKRSSLLVQISQLEHEKKTSMDELRQGYYCDQCWNSKSEIERRGTETFAQHLRRVNGRMVSAPPDKIREKEDDYNRKIDEIKKQIDQLDNNLSPFDARIRELQDENDRLHTKDIPESQKSVENLARQWRDEKYKQLLDHKGSLAKTALDEAMQLFEADKEIMRLKSELDEHNRDYVEKFAEASRKLEEKFESEKRSLDDRIKTQNDNIAAARQTHNRQMDQMENQTDAIRNDIEQLKRRFQTEEMEANRNNIRQQINDHESALRQAEQDISNAKIQHTETITQMEKQHDDLSAEKRQLETNKPAAIQEMTEQLDNAFKERELLLRDILSSTESRRKNLQATIAANEDKRIEQSMKLSSESQNEFNKVKSLCNEANADFDYRNAVFATRDEEYEHYFGLLRSAILSGSPCAQCPSYAELEEESDTYATILKLGIQTYQEYKEPEMRNKRKREEKQEQSERQLNYLIRSLE